MDTEELNLVVALTMLGGLSLLYSRWAVGSMIQTLTGFILLATLFAIILVITFALLT